MGGGDTSSGSSRPLNAKERTDLFNAGTSLIGDNASWLSGSEMQYQAPTTQRLSSGDYDALQQSLQDTQTSQIDQQWRQRQDSINQDMADRGLYTSGIGAQQENKIFANDFLPAYQQAASSAASERYGMEASDNSAANEMAMSNAQSDYASSWGPYEYLMGLYNGTGGTIQKQSSSGWKFL